MTTLFVEQNLDTILALSDRVYVMEKGRVVADIATGHMNAETVRRHLTL